MSDYLNNLAARAFGLADVILPRLASLFEPLSLGRQPISRVWDENNGQDSSSSIFDYMPPGEERMAPRPLSPRRTIDASKEIIGDNKVEFIPVSPIKKIPEGLPQYNEIDRAEPSSHPPSKAIMQSSKADHFAEKPSGISNTDKPVPDYLKRNDSVEKAANMGPPEQPKFREIKRHEDIRPSSTVKREIQPLFTHIIKQIATEQIVSEPLLVAPRNEKIPSSLSIEKEVRSSTIESPTRVIENKQISEVAEKILVSHSQPASHRMIQPFTGVIPVQTNSIKRIRQTDANIIESKLRRKQDNNIQVTIGSIEVRATLPSVRTKNERKTPPVMSLDEYLQIRGGSR